MLDPRGLIDLKKNFQVLGTAGPFQSDAVWYVIADVEVKKRSHLLITVRKMQWWLNVMLQAVTGYMNYWSCKTAPEENKAKAVETRKQKKKKGYCDGEK